MKHHKGKEEKSTSCAKQQRAPALSLIHISPRARGRLAALLAVLMGIDLVFFLVGTFS